MQGIKRVVVASMLIGAAACGDRTPPLQQNARPNDVAWVDSLITQPTASPTELGFMARDSSDQAVTAPAKAIEKPAATSSRTTRHRSSGARRSSGSSGSSGSTARQGRVVTRRHTTRDAAIGAGAGAVIGAATGGRHRVRNAAVGAVLGGAAGAVIGHSVDKQTRVEY
jgi:hypothetical protein